MRARSRIASILMAAALVAGSTGPAHDRETGPDSEYPHGTYESDCATCHRIEEWNAVKPGPDFDHGKVSGFPLKGAHEGIYCKVCHKNLDFTKASPTCAACHSDVHRGEFGVECARCHTTRNFIGRAGDVEAHRLTRFPLEGVHASLDCKGCHGRSLSGQGSFVKTPAECERCHLDDYKAAKSPDHVAAGFATDCKGCHTPKAWRPPRR